MRRSIFRHLFLIITAYTLISGCAKVSAPAGGPRDRVPPVVVKTNPVNGARFFSGKKVEIEFNEYVTLDKINEKFMISPPMKKRPEVSIKGKSVVVEYEDELKDSTTYTLYFGDAVRDLNEGNVYAGLQFVFSTGAVIDSLSLTGNVLNAFVLDAPEAPIILLYSDLSPEAVRKSFPDYITRPDINGYFRIDNIREGRYRLYALKDNDNSRSFNLAGEEFAFLDEAVEVTPLNNYLPVREDTVKTVKAPAKTAEPEVLKGEHMLIMFLHEKTASYLTSSTRTLPYHLTYTLALPPADQPFEVSIPGSSEGSFFIERSTGNDTVHVWITDSIIYSSTLINTLVTYPFTDTSGATVSKLDTVPMRFVQPRAPRGGVKAPVFELKHNIPGGNVRPGQKIIFQSETPMREPDTARIRFYEMKGAERIRLPYAFVRDSASSRRIFLDVSLVPGKTYLYTADSASFGNIYGVSSDSTGMRISVREEKSFGKLVLNVKGYEGSRIIQLLDKSEKPVREVRMDTDGKAEFPMLDKGAYRMRVIYDRNGDGRWTTGNFDSGIQPEAVSFYPQEIEIKEDWVLDQDWDISKKNEKKLKSVPRQGQGR